MRDVRPELLREGVTELFAKGNGTYPTQKWAARQDLQPAGK